MKFFIDTEFNGFGGKLMSMAIVPEDKILPEFYREIMMSDQLDPWVAQHVVPHMSKMYVSYSQFQTDLSNYLNAFRAREIIIVADWPDDIRYFCEALIVGPGERIVVPNNIKFELDLSIEYTSEVPHNALYDARAIRNTYAKR